MGIILGTKIPIIDQIDLTTLNDGGYYITNRDLREIDKPTEQNRDIINHSKLIVGFSMVGNFEGNR